MKIGLVGVGSLGGFIAKKLQSKVDTIYAVDPDIVEERNLRNSIYTKKDINKPKVMALKDKVTECTFVPIQKDIRKTNLPKVDQLIDCRDVISRNIDTDVKFTIASERLRVDCRKPNTVKRDVSGRYFIELGKQTISRAGTLASRVVMSDKLKLLKDKNQRIYLPISDFDVEVYIDKYLKRYEGCGNLEVNDCMIGHISNYEDTFFFNPNPGGA